MKSELRNRFLEKRKALTPLQREHFSLEICNTLLNLPALAHFTEISCYEPFKTEVDIRHFVAKKNKMGVKTVLPETSPNHIEAWIIPGIAFDKVGHRIGYGKGIYDRLLETAPGLKVGVCFSCQVSSHPLPAQSHDVKLDILVTENQVYSFNT